ncbi:SDR family NAD(P)-dependent oxidoreductase [Luteolibacter yonseiensis]|uniref:SDR family NAD(P)-dependent oxidoreductase n=1 Tax=Luteolibacter yonseiensis TaxID=1144680 RepID=A0A934VAZ5_9BACT|nr:SDR family NAD(P)-dependent oxidoreductase [Luteolibacter yonseiensis]MBK1814869.1 SDR family NAD(P)-dependent oxidoreductase [Luteolibacter yonseiensis]
MKQLVITGGSGGLGNAILSEFPESAWKIFAPPRDELDVGDPEAIRRILTARTADLFIHSAGIIRDAPLLRQDENAWDEVMAVNYQGAADCAAALLPAMIRRGAGHLVFISSYSALHPPVGQVAYATAKAALLGLVNSLARENGRHGIRVNAILPGFLETRMTRAVTDRRKSAILEDHVLGCFNTPGAVAKFIRHLHDDLPAVSGQIFQLDSRVS